jgi:hypothetical protein
MGREKGRYRSKWNTNSRERRLRNVLENGMLYFQCPWRRLFPINLNYLGIVTLPNCVTQHSTKELQINFDFQQKTFRNIIQR